MFFLYKISVKHSLSLYWNMVVGPSVTKRPYVMVLALVMVLTLL